MSFEKTESRKRPWSIGARLTLWASGFTFLVCLLVCAIFYAGISISLHSEVDSFLRGEMDEFVGLVRQHSFDIPAAEQQVRSHLGSRSRHDLGFRLVDSAGRVVLTSLVEDDFPAGKPQAINEGRPLNTPRFETVYPPNLRHPIRLCSMPIQSPQGTLYIAQAGYLLDRMNESLHTVGLLAGALMLLGTIMAVIGGRLLARRSLDPLNRMDATARLISTTRLSDRLPRSHNGDELDRLAATLNDLLGRTERYVDRMQRFTADASHELRSPLAALQGMAEVALSRDRSPDELRQVIESSLEHFRQVRHITDDLLLLARIDGGEDVFSRQPVRLDQALDDVVDLFSPVAADRGIQLTFDERTPLTVTGDAGRLRQVLANLVDNAVKYTDGPGRVEVSLGQSNGHARIRIQDTGIGIPPEKLKHVFDRFYRVDRSRTSARGAGAGLGLAICQSIITAHHGHITLHSPPGGGTTATVELPLDKA